MARQTTTRPPLTYDGGWFYPKDPFYHTIDPRPAEVVPVLHTSAPLNETETERNHRLHTLALATDKSLEFRYAGGSRPGQLRTVQPLQSHNAATFKAREAGGGSMAMKTFLFSLVSDMELVEHLPVEQ